MLAKKSQKAEIGAYSKIFFQLGLLLSLVIIYTAIEWRTFDRTISELSALNIQEEEIIDIPITEIILEVKQITMLIERLIDVRLQQIEHLLEIIHK